MRATTKWLIGILAVGVVGTPFAFVAAFESETSRREEATFARIRALGHAPTLAEYRKNKPRDNAVDEWIRQSATWSDRADALPRNPFAPDGSVSKEMREYVSTRKHRIDALLANLERYSKLWVDPNIFTFVKLFERRSWQASLHAAAMIDFESGDTEKGWRRAQTLAHIVRLQAEANIANPSFSPVGELSELACTMAARSPSLQERRRWEAWLKQNDLPYDLRKRVGR